MKKGYYLSVDYFKKKLIEIASSHELYICGGGSYGMIIYNWARKVGIDIKGIVDKKAHEIRMDKDWYAYEDITPNMAKNGVYIIATRFFNSEIEEELVLLGINQERILRIDDIKLFDEIAYDIRKINEVKKKWVNESFKDVHKGKRAFLIGNGPSLRLADLERLSNEITFATNGLYQAILQSSWRPTYFFVHDKYLADSVFSEKKQLEWLLASSGAVFCEVKSSIYEKYQDSMYKNLYFYKSDNISIEDTRNEGQYFSEDITMRTYMAGTTVYDFYQFAAFMGISDIYLLGMDFDFSNIIDSDGHKELREDFNDHASFLKTNKEKQVYNIELIRYAHKSAREYAEAHGIRIFNATRGGKLNDFARVEFDDLFN